MQLTIEQKHKYFEARLGRALRGPQAAVKCPFHDDRNASMSVNLLEGVWNCHAGCGSGGVVDFEIKFSGAERDKAWGNIGEVIGLEQTSLLKQEPEAIYRYTDGHGRLLFEKVRYPGKRFVQRKPVAGGYEYKLGNIAKPLYRLEEVLRATWIAIVEGEKDADNLKEALSAVTSTLGPHYANWAVTTNFDGAGKWSEDYSPLFAAKYAMIFTDNDDIGRRHGENIAASVHKYAKGVKVVHLPGLPEKGDVSDFLKEKTVEQLLAEARMAPRWQPAKTEESSLLVPARVFLNTIPDDVDWMVEGLIERGANGVIAAVPKGGKSWSAADLVIALSTGTPWLEFAIPRPVRTAFIAREDNPSLTGWRLNHLIHGRGLDPNRVSENLYLNTRAQSDQLMVDNEDQMAELKRALVARKIEFALFDVLNVLHSADENDNTEMRRVLSRLSQLKADTGCSIGLVHHYAKLPASVSPAAVSPWQRLRGASAILGWTEWLIGISVVDDVQQIRRMEFELKAAQPPDPIHWKIETEGDTAKILCVAWEPPVSETPYQRAKALVK